MARPAFESMTNKQKATLLLFVLHQTLVSAVQRSRPRRDDDPQCPPERPNGGRWLADCTVTDPKNTSDLDRTYASSGPVQVNHSKNNDGVFDCRMFDCQSVFGDAHWAYASFPYRVSLQSILRFYASFLPCDVKTDRNELYELIPEFEKLHILRRDGQTGEIHLDLPAMTFEETLAYWDPAIRAITKDLHTLLADELTRLWEAGKHRVPAYVDAHGYYEYENAVAAYPKAQMLEIVHRGLLPYPVTVGETPLIFVVYRPKM